MSEPKKKSSNLPKIALAVVVMLIAVWLAWRQVSPPPPEPVISPTYYYDLESDELFVAGSDKVPPFDAPSGGQAVAAHVFSCGACEADEQFIAFFTKYDDATRDALAAMTLEQRTYADTDVQMMMQEGQLVRAKDGDRWLPFGGQAGMTILQNVPMRCGGPEAPVTACEPR